jgi:hypothetical protein
MFTTSAIRVPANTSYLSAATKHLPVVVTKLHAVIQIKIISQRGTIGFYPLPGIHRDMLGMLREPLTHNDCYTRSGSCFSYNFNNLENQLLESACPW